MGRSRSAQSVRSFPMPKSTRSHHLKVLREAGVMRTEARGRERVLTLRRDDLEERFPGLELVIIESGGDNLTAVFSRGLADSQVFVVDVAGGDKVPRKGGPGVTTADLLVINKIDIAHLVGADMAVMTSDAHRMRGDLPVITQSLVETPNAPEVAAWVRSLLPVKAG